MIQQFEIFFEGNTMNASVEIDEKKIENLTETEKADYIHKQAYECVRDNFEICIR